MGQCKAGQTSGSQHNPSTFLLLPWPGCQRALPLQEVAAHQELSEHGALNLSTCLQSFLQEEMPGKGNEAMEKLAELPLPGTVPWLRDLLGC